MLLEIVGIKKKKKGGELSAVRKGLPNCREPLFCEEIGATGGSDMVYVNA